jgi:hypothetical protein
LPNAYSSAPFATAAASTAARKAATNRIRQPARLLGSRLQGIERAKFDADRRLLLGRESGSPTAVGLCRGICSPRSEAGCVDGR